MLSDDLGLVDSEPGSRRKKLNQLRSIADRFNAIVSPAAACKKSCSHCCHITTTITETEAQAIADHTGKQINKKLDNAFIPERSSIEEAEACRESDIKRVHGTPCPFLDVGNLCTISYY